MVHRMEVVLYGTADKVLRIETQDFLDPGMEDMTVDLNSYLPTTTISQ